MAYDGNFTSIKPIIESVYRDSGIEEINFETALEDAGELIGLLGVPYTYIDKNTNSDDGISEAYDTLVSLQNTYPDGKDGLFLVKSNNHLYTWSSSLDAWADNGLYVPQSPLLVVVNYRAYLPPDLVYVISMRRVEVDSNNKITSSSEMVENPSMFFYDKVLNNSSGTNWVRPTSDHPLNTVEDDELTTENGVVVGQSQLPYNTMSHGYRINNGVIFTDFESGYIELAYKAYPVDSDGFLLVPDDEKLRVAIKYHLIYKIDYRNWRVNPASPGMKALLNDSEQKRDFYVGAARNKAHIPTIDKMESIKNRWISLIPRINEHRNGFATLNNQERRRY